MKLTKMLTASFLTLIILLILEILATSFIPAFISGSYRLGFNILLILYMGFRIQSPKLPFLIILVQLIHSAFSIEGWALGTFAGILTCMLIGQLKDILHLTSSLLTIFIVEMLQILWFIVESSIIYFRVDNFSYLFDRTLFFIPGSLALSLLSPFFFKVMDKIWNYKADIMGVNF